MIPQIQIPDFAGNLAGIQNMQENRLLRMAQLQGQQAEQQERQRSQMREQLPLIASMLGGVTPENYGEVRARALAAGLSPQVLPETFDPVRVEGVRNAANALRSARVDEEVAKQNALLPGRMAVAQAGRTSVNVRLPPAENEFEQRRGRAAADNIEEIETAGGRAAATVGRLTQFEALLERFPTGTLAEGRLRAGQLAQQLGIPDSALPQGFNRDAVASAETLRSLTSQLVQGQLGPGGFPTNNFSNTDLQFLLQATPNIANTPDGNRLMVRIARNVAERNVEVARAWRDYARQNGETATSFRQFQRDVLPGIAERSVVPQDALRALQAPAGGVAIPGTGMTASPPQAPGANISRPPQYQNIPPPPGGGRIIFPGQQ